MSKFYVARVEQVTNVRIVLVEGDNYHDAVSEPGAEVSVHDVARTSTMASAVIDEARYDLAWVSRTIARLKSRT